jgi:hypothetical protein
MSRSWRSLLGRVDYTADWNWRLYQIAWREFVSSGTAKVVVNISLKILPFEIPALRSCMRRPQSSYEVSNYTLLAAPSLSVS